MAVFLSVVGGKTYSLLRDLCAPSKLVEKSVEELSAVLRKHFDPKPLLTAEKFCFHQRGQGPTETIAEYVTELRRLASRCEFGAEYCDDTLRDHLVCGLRSESIQKKLLTTADLTLALAIEIAQGMETADLGAKKFQDTTGVVQKMDFKHESEKSSHSHDSKERVCYHCGSREHLANTCRFRDAECRRCQKRGHVSRMCRSTGVQNPRKPPGSKPGATRDTKWVQVEEDVNEEDNQLPVFKLGQKASPPIVVTMEVEGIHLPMEVDTGAAVSVISACTKYPLQ